MRPLRRRYGHTTATSEIVSTRKTFDGVRVHLHADGAISDRSRYVSRAKLPRDMMWRVWGDIETYTHEELPGLIKAAKTGRFEPVRIRKPMTEAQHEAVLADQVRRHVHWVDGFLTPINPGRRK